MQKACSICKQVKDYSEFYPDKRTKTGLYSGCRTCLAKIPKKYDYSKHKAWKKKYTSENLYRTYAHRWVQVALDRKDLVRLPCEVCQEEKTDAHHEDYTHPLEVRWFCRKHHKQRHKNLIP